MDFDQLNFMTGNWFITDNQKFYFVEDFGYTGEDGIKSSISNDKALNLLKI